MRNDSDAGNMTKKKKWYYPPQIKEFKKFDENMFSPRLSDYNSDGRFGPE